MRKERCWSCNGSGVGSVALFNTANKDIPCDRCQGSGKCPSIMREWQAIGKAMKARRIFLGHSLSAWAKKHGYRRVDLSKAERGIIDPEPLTPHEFNEQVSRHRPKREIS